MEFYRRKKKDDVTATMNDLQSDFLPSDTWGILETPADTTAAEKAFLSALGSDEIEKAQEQVEQLAAINPKKYGSIAPVRPGEGAIEYNVFSTDSGSKILFVTNYAQKAVKSVLTASSIGKGMKIHTAKIRNKFNPLHWRKYDWFFVAMALVTGEENEFPEVSKFDGLRAAERF